MSDEKKRTNGNTNTTTQPEKNRYEDAFEIRQKTHTKQVATWVCAAERQTPEFPATKYESAQAGNAHQHDPRSRVKVQSVTFPSTRLILNSGLRPVSMRTCRRLHLQVGTRRRCVCAPIYIFSFRRSSWGTAYDKNNLTGLNARTACIRAAALSAFSTGRRVCAAIHVHVCGRYVLSCAPRGRLTSAAARHGRESKARRVFCFCILFLYLWCLVAVGSCSYLVGALH